MADRARLRARSLAGTVLASLVVISGCSSHGGTVTQGSGPSTAPSSTGQSPSGPSTTGPIVGPTSSTTATTPPATGSPTGRPAKNATQLRSAIQAVVRGDTGQFTEVIVGGGHQIGGIAGGYSLSTHKAVVQVVSGAALASTTGATVSSPVYVIHGGTTYAGTRPSGALASCWVTLTSSSPPVDGLTAQPFPGQITALQHVGDLQIGNGGIATGTIPLAAALSIVAPSVQRVLTPSQATAPVTASFAVSGGTLQSWRVDGSNILTTLAKQRIRLPRLTVAYLHGSYALINYANVGAALQLGLPDSAPVVSAGDPSLSQICQNG